MSDYDHVQPGTATRWLLLGCLVAFVLFASILQARGVEGAATLWIPCLPLALLLPLFHSLRVRVTQERIELRFGIGLVRRSIPLAELASARIVENHWWNGWGIKKIRKGWLFNVSGFDAVEVRTKKGRVTRIGTDEPRALLAVIQKRLAGGEGIRP